MKTLAPFDLVLCGHNHLYERSLLLDGLYGDSWSFDRQIHAVDASRGRTCSTGAYRKPSLGPAPHEGTVYVVAGFKVSVATKTTWRLLCFAFFR